MSAWPRFYGIRGERVTRPHRLQTGYFRRRDCDTTEHRVGFGGELWHGFAPALTRPLLMATLQVAVVLQRKIFPRRAG